MDEKYILFLNEKIYGSGNLKYINELITDYLITSEMYKAEEVVFKIVERSRVVKYLVENSMEQNHKLLKRLAEE